ncbi:hypothetical protein JIR001_16950 [Polycladomyces abyssicola]|uniref:Uncharacterized protein n=1 Tax=Polycladomyces abyssicola TaxID=1125966 RepID=A0A8D5UEM5_9BACL|nr:hypothetical protein JIR001_16950 [Polycladomyces abyssicola]
MAMAGKPASTIPCNARITNNSEKLGLNAARIDKTEESISETVMMGLRPFDSDTNEMINMHTARAPVVSDNDRLADAGET